MNEVQTDKYFIFCCYINALKANLLIQFKHILYTITDLSESQRSLCQNGLKGNDNKKINLRFLWGSPCGVAANVLDCNIIVSEFELQ